MRNWRWEFEETKNGKMMNFLIDNPSNFLTAITFLHWMKIIVFFSKHMNLWELDWVVYCSSFYWQRWCEKFSFFFHHPMKSFSFPFWVICQKINIGGLKRSSPSRMLRVVKDFDTKIFFSILRVLHWRLQNHEEMIWRLCGIFDFSFLFFANYSL